MGIESTLIPGRFLMTLGHFLAIIIAVAAIDDNIRAGLDSDVGKSDSKWTDAESSVTAALALSIIGIAIEFFGLMFGFTMFNNGLNILSIIFHFLGAVLVCLYVINEWSYSDYWYIWGFLSFPPALWEVTCIFIVGVLRRSRY